MNEANYEAHRQKDSVTAFGWLIGFVFFPGLRWLIPVLILLIGMTWGINMLGESTALNGNDIWYMGRNANTGKQEVRKGCRPERVLANGECDKSITLETARKAFPFFSQEK